MLPVFQVFMIIAAVWGVAYGDFDWSRTLIIMAGISSFGSCWFSLHVTRWAWSIAIKDNRLPSESRQDIFIQVYDPATKRREVLVFCGKKHENAFNCGQETNLRLAMDHSRLMLIPPLTLSAMAIPAPGSRFFDNQEWEDYPWPSDGPVALARSRVARPDPESTLSPSLHLRLDTSDIPQRDPIPWQGLVEASEPEVTNPAGRMRLAAILEEQEEEESRE